MTTQPRHPRSDGQATRAAILQAAQQLFVELGYEHTTVRTIADRAGCNAALITRYFGGKAELFAAIARRGTIDRADEHTLRDIPFRSWGNELVRRQLRIAGQVGRDDLYDQQLMLLRSAATGQGARMLGDFLTRGDTQLLPRLAGPDALLRNALIQAQLAGLVTLREIARVPQLREADPNTIAHYLGPALQHLMRPDPGGRPGN